MFHFGDRNMMDLRRRLLKLFLALLSLSLGFYTFVEVYNEPFVTMQIWRTLRIISTYGPIPGNNGLANGSTERRFTELRNDWIEDCSVPNNTDYDFKTMSDRCLKMLDLTDKLNCDTKCQKFIQKYRRKNTKCACRNNPNSFSTRGFTDRKATRKLNTKSLHHLFSIENSKIIFCYIPKNGCTVWKRILLTVNGDISSPSAETEDIHSLFRKKIKPLSRYSKKEAEIRLKTYKKFLFVREPMERLLSLFLDKAVHERRLPFDENQFEDFLKFITEQPFKPILFAEHWAHAFQLCLPCEVDYDFIGRLETSDRDTQYVFDNFIHKNNDLLTLHLKTNHSTNSSNSNKKLKYFEQVSDDVLRKVVDRFHLDYVLFNYNKPYSL